MVKFKVFYMSFDMKCSCEYNNKTWNVSVLTVHNCQPLQYLHKGTDKKTLLTISFHLRRIKYGLPLCHFDRLKRICSSAEAFEARSEYLKNKFPTRCYFGTRVWLCL